ncbi:MAG: MFS transporter [Xanthobacteraceae bacterium]
MTVASAPISEGKPRRAFSMVWAASITHGINDMLQALLPAVYPILQGGFDLSFTQVGILTFVYQLTASLFQPFIGHYTDRRPLPYSLPFAMVASMAGILMLAFAPNYGVLLLACVLLGLGSSIFHPETARIARLASGGAHGLAQSMFQVGGNFGTALGPLAAAFIVLPRGQSGLAWFALVAIVGIVILSAVGRWYSQNLPVRRAASAAKDDARFSNKQLGVALAILLALLFSKWVYLASFTSFYIFFLIDKFALSIQTAQILQFAFFAAVAVGGVAGGALGDRYGRKLIIWVSILGALPFTLALPFVGLTATVVLSIVIGLTLASAFPAIVVFGQELMPGRIGMVSGLFYGFIFGISGIGAATLGMFADWYGVGFVFQICAVLPALGLLTAFLPNVDRR